MDLYSDNVIEIINRHLPKDGNEWDLVGLINKDKEILSFGHDSKIIAILSICAEYPALLVRGWIARRAKHDWAFLV
jgi:hypothetical protein